MIAREHDAKRRQSMTLRKTVLGIFAVMALAVIMSLALTSKASAETTYTLQFKDDQQNPITALDNLEVGVPFAVSVTASDGTHPVDISNLYWSVEYIGDNNFLYKVDASSETQPNREIIMGKDIGTATLIAHATITEEEGESSTTVPVDGRIPVKVSSNYSMTLTNGQTPATTAITSHVGEKDLLQANLSKGTGDGGSFFVEWDVASAETEYFSCDKNKSDLTQATISGYHATPDGVSQQLTATAYRRVTPVEGQGTTVKVKLAFCTPSVTVKGSRYELTLSVKDKTISNDSISIIETEKMDVTATLTNSGGKPLDAVDVDLNVSNEAGKKVLDYYGDYNEQTHTAPLIGRTAGEATITATAKFGNVSVTDPAILSVEVTASGYQLAISTDGVHVGTQADVTAAIVKADESLSGADPDEWDVYWDAGSRLELAESTTPGEDEKARITGLEKGSARVSAKAYNKYIPYTVTGYVDINVAESELELELRANNTPLHEEGGVAVLDNLKVGQVVPVSAVLKDASSEIASSVAWDYDPNDAFSFDAEHSTITGQGNDTATITATASITVEGIPIEVKSKKLRVTSTYLTLANDETAKISGSRTFSFKPAEEGNYVFYANYGDASPTAGTIVDADELGRKTGYDNKVFWVCFHADTIDPCYLPVSADITGGNYTVGVEAGPQFFEEYSDIWPVAADPVSVGDVDEVNTDYDRGLFKFVPSATQNYTVYAAGSGTAEPRVRVLDDNGTEIAPGVSAEDRGNALYYHSEEEFSATAGKTYYLQAVNVKQTAKFNFGLENGAAETEQAARDALAKAQPYTKNASAYTQTSYKKLVAAMQAVQSDLDNQASLTKMRTDTNTLNAAIKGMTYKYNNPLKVTSKNKNYKVKTVRKKKRTYKALTVTGAQGKVSYTVKYANKKSKKALKLYTSTGKITVKKKTKKGTYKVTVTVKAAGNGDYKPSAAIKKTIKVKVK